VFSSCLSNQSLRHSVHVVEHGGPANGQIFSKRLDIDLSCGFADCALADIGEMIGGSNCS